MKQVPISVRQQEAIMPSLNSIPDDTRWRLAAEFSARLPFLYDRAFRSALGDRFDEIEQEVWMEAAASAFEIAKTLSLPVGTPKELAETMRIVMIILFGPEFKSEVLEVSKDGAVIVVKRCPFLSGRIDADSAGGHAFRKCMAFTLTAVPRLNSGYSARFVRTMCTSDRQCEIKISPGEKTGPQKPAKKGS